MMVSLYPSTRRHRYPLSFVVGIAVGLASNTPTIHGDDSLAAPSPTYNTTTTGTGTTSEEDPVACEKAEWDDLSEEAQDDYELLLQWYEKKWDHNLVIRSEEDVHRVYWADICDSYQNHLSKQGWTESTWDASVERRGGVCKMASWEELSEESREHYEEKFDMDEEDWNEKRWIAVYGFPLYKILWRDLCDNLLLHLKVRGWNQEAWDEQDGTKVYEYISNYE